MASEILVKINVESGKATASIKEVKEEVKGLSSSVKLYTEEQKKAVIERLSQQVEALVKRGNIAVKDL